MEILVLIFRLRRYLKRGKNQTSLLKECLTHFLPLCLSKTITFIKRLSVVTASEHWSSSLCHSLVPHTNKEHFPLYMIWGTFGATQTNNMKKTLIAATFLLFGLSSNAQTIPSWKITDVVKYCNEKTDSVYVINFWATWCRPCVEELPYLQSITKKYADKKVELLLVSLDLASFYPEKIEAFVKKQNINANIVWLNETNADYFCNMIDKKWSGSIPATVIVNPSKGYKKFYELQFDEEEFEEELKKAF